MSSCCHDLTSENWTAVSPATYQNAARRWAKASRSFTEVSVRGWPSPRLCEPTLSRRPPPPSHPPRERVEKVRAKTGTAWFRGEARPLLDTLNSFGNFGLFLYIQHVYFCPAEC